MADSEDVASVITPEAFDGEDIKAESSTVEAKASVEEKSQAKPEEAEAKAEGKEDEASKKEVEVAEPPKDTESVEEATDDAVKPEEKPKADEKPLAPKSENRFQTLANENRELRRQLETLTSQVYQPATEDDLISEVNPETGENYNRLEAKFESYRQQQELDKYNSQVVNAQAEIGGEAYSVMNDFPKFNPSSDQYDEDLAVEAAQLLDANLIRDPNVPELDEKGQPTGKGIIIGSNVSPYQLYKTLDRAAGMSAVAGQLKGQQATEQMLANADTASSASPPKEKSDPIAELWKDPL